MLRFIIWCKPLARYFLVAWIITILVVSSIPSLPTLKIHTAKAEIRLDYLIHFCEYGSLAFLAFLTFIRKEFKVNYSRFSLITILLAAFAILDEFHQKFIPGRSYNIIDILSNIAGIVAAVVFCLVVFRMISLIYTPDQRKKSNAQIISL
jgi:VanZ family protein